MYHWQIYCGFYPIAAGRRLAISGIPGQRLIWRTELDAVTIVRLRSGFSMYINPGDRWILYRMDEIVPIVGNTYDVILHPLEGESTERLRDRLQQMTKQTVAESAIGKIKTVS